MRWPSQYSADVGRQEHASCAVAPLDMQQLWVGVCPFHRDILKKVIKVTFGRVCENVSARFTDALDESVPQETKPKVEEHAQHKEDCFGELRCRENMIEGKRNFRL